MTAKTIMLQGSSSSAGKSLLVAALCRIYARRGMCVAPYKSQNMSNNAAVCADGSEIGRAQALQAAAAGLAPTVDMNPILIKPEADSRSQIILMGRPWQTLAAKTYYEKKAILWESARASLDRLRSEYDLVIIEGAGSPVELNLKRGDIVNMAVARYAQSPVLLIGDIDRGGIFAQLLGTLWLLEPEERTLVRGLLVNKFRGDLSLFDDGIHILEQKGDVPVLGVIPYLKGLALPDEDAVSVETASSPALASVKQTDIAVLALPRIANFDDFDPLKAEPNVRLRYVKSVSELGNPHAIIIPGTKSTIADLDWLRQTGLADAVTRFGTDGGAVVGLCGGYQMLGKVILDPAHVESRLEQAAGLGLLSAQTNFLAEKATCQARAQIQHGNGWLETVAGLWVEGYEIHMGETTVSGRNWLEVTERNRQPVHIPDGAASDNGHIWGCYLHGIFGNDAFRHAWLKSLGWGDTGISQKHALENSLNALADAVENALDMQKLEKIIWES
jgi:adenosylcobyric acid synthase